MHPLGRSVRLPLIRPPVDGARGREIRRQRPPHRPVVSEVADRVDDIAHAPAGRAAAAPGQPRRGRHSGSQTAHSASVMSEGYRRSGGCGRSRPGSTGTPPRREQRLAGHHDRRQGRTARGLLASRWLRHPSDYQGPLASHQRHAAPCPEDPICPPVKLVLKQALSATHDPLRPGRLTPLGPLPTARPRCTVNAPGPSRWCCIRSSLPTRDEFWIQDAGHATLRPVTESAALPPKPLGDVVGPV